LPFNVNVQTLLPKAKCCHISPINKREALSVNHFCKKLRGKTYSEEGFLVTNYAKEMRSACPYYIGEEKKAPEGFKFNPLLDMVNY